MPKASEITLQGKEVLTGTHNKPYEDEKLYKYILDQYKMDKEVIKKRDLPKYWADYEKLYRNLYWEGSTKPSHLTRATSNAMFETVETLLPVVTSRIPEPDIKVNPTIEKYMEYQQVLEGIGKIEDENIRAEAITLANADWQAFLDWAKAYSENLRFQLIQEYKDSDMAEKTRRGFREHEIKGKYILKSLYVNGHFENEICDLESLVPHRFADSIKACEKTHLSHAVFKDVEWIEKNYGVKVKAEGYFDEQGDFYYYSNPNNMTGAVSGAVDKVKDALGAETKTDKGYALVIEFYSPAKIFYEDPEYAEYTVSEYNEDGTEKLGEGGEVLKKKEVEPIYQTGLRITTVIRSWKNVIVRSIPLKYNRFPFLETTNYGRANDFWGTSEGHNIKSQIEITNVLISNIADNARLTGNPQKVIMIGADIKEVVDEPGAKYESAESGGVQNLTPPSMPNYIPQFIDYLKVDQDRKTGNSDAFRGLTEYAGESGKHHRSVISQATGRLQPKTMEFVNLARNWYEHVAFCLKKFGPEEILQRISQETGQLEYRLFRPKEHSDQIELEINVNQTSVLPFDEYAEFEEGMVLFKVGVEAIGLPLLSPQHLIELAPTLREKQRAIKWIVEQLGKLDENQQNAADAQGEEDDLASGKIPFSKEELDVLAQARKNKDISAVEAIIRPRIQQFRDIQAQQGGTPAARG